HFSTWLEQADIDGHPCIVAMSSMSAESKHESPLAEERALSQRLREAEARLARTCARRGMRWTVLRATLIYGGGHDHSLTPLARRAQRWRVFPLPAGRGLRQPVHAADLAEAVRAALHTDAAGGKVLPVGGGERLTAARMFARVRQGLPGWTLPVPVPRLVLRAAARFFPRGRGAIMRLDADLVADNRELIACLGVHPRDFRP
uniref:SDR family oxidoreductase n=1 Tax=Oleiagrimonas sp. TaxID=2010330 RepID=UPI002625BF35